MKHETQPIPNTPAWQAWAKRTGYTALPAKGVWRPVEEVQALAGSK